MRCRWVMIVALAAFAIGAIVQRTVHLGLALQMIGVRAAESATTTSARTTDLPDSLDGHVSLFLMAGQSNMVGYGDTLDLPRNRARESRVFVLGDDYRWHRAREPLTPFGAGLGVAFGHAVMQRDPSRIVGLVPCAVGSTSMAAWRPSAHDGSLYNECLKRARVAALQGRWAGILWWQGEQDAGDPHADDWRTWPGEFTRLIAQFRHDLGDAAVPVIFAQLGEPNGQSPLVRSGWERFKQMQATIRIPSTRMIRTDDLPQKPASLHFTTASYDTIGRRFAEAWVTLARNRE